MTVIQSIKEIIETKKKQRSSGNIAFEFQDYGVRLAEALRDLKHKSFYIKLAKKTPRAELEKARDFALGYFKAQSKAKIFMWFLKNNSHPSKVDNLG